MEHAGLYVSDVRSRALEQQLQGIPQAVVLENAFRQQYLFVPNMKLKRPVIPDSPLTTGQGPQGCVCTGQGERKMVGVGGGAGPCAHFTVLFLMLSSAQPPPPVAPCACSWCEALQSFSCSAVQSGRRR